MGKEKKEKRKSENLDESTAEGKEVWEDKMKNLNAISKPLASRKLSKKLCKTIKKGKDMRLVLVVFSPFKIIFACTRQ